MSTLFIADLHLDPRRPEITDTLLDFLRSEQARTADKLYILGDLFEAWIGDDAAFDPAPQVAEGIRELSQYTPVEFVCGNRDFLLGHEYCELAGMTYRDEPIQLNLHGVDTVLLHGDVLCTDDLAYQQFRQMVRNPDWQSDFLSKPLEERLAMAKQAREQSQAHTGSTDMQIMDVNDDAVSEYFEATGARRMIHGHTHRPAIHERDDGTERIVLGDWFEQGSLLRVDDEGVELIDMAHEA